MARHSARRYRGCDSRDGAPLQDRPGRDCRRRAVSQKRRRRRRPRPSACRGGPHRPRLRRPDPPEPRAPVHGRGQGRWHRGSVNRAQWPRRPRLRAHRARCASTADVMLAGAWKTARMVAHYSAGARAERGAVARYPLTAGAVSLPRAPGNPHAVPLGLARGTSPGALGLAPGH